MAQNELGKIFEYLNPKSPENLDGEWFVTSPNPFLPPPFMVYLILVHCLGCIPIDRPQEKMAWIAYFSFRDKPMFAAHSKSGLQFGIKDKQEAEILEDFLILLKKSLPVANEAFQDLVKTSFSNGQISIENKSFLFRERYLFLRKQAELKFHQEQHPLHAKTIDSKDSISRGNPLEDSVNTLNNFSEAHREGFFLASTSLDAYFSALEHYLILLLPFTDFNPCQENILEFVRGSWEKSFQRIFGKPPANEAEQTVLEKLKQIKRKWRNTLAHGGFDYEGQTFFVQVPGLGSIPASLAKDESRFQFPSLPITYSDFKEICAALDECDALLKNGSFKLAFQYIDAGLNLYLDERSRRGLKAALSCEQEMVSFIEHQCYLEDMYTNMDW
ncbi:hypothetical protein [Brasilonema sp. UFV-L1]|uniref:hypothetical protein n=1 Tax=Brasilonema sp. UFV-L1 TaxID=2234130 RepID=UPI00145FBD0E|nr:hypothetical protein [Brasilonema sp. UFV-L1]NMG09109.1 hypothetical protein [Brasilonema sp. UFV-L1]